MNNVNVLSVFSKALDCSIKGLGEKLLLFRHEPDTEQILHRLTDQHHIRDGDLLEVVLSGQYGSRYDFLSLHTRLTFSFSLNPLEGTASVAETKYRPHSLVVQSYRTPTFCHYCGEMLWGLVRQGLKCEGTSRIFMHNAFKWVSHLLTCLSLCRVWFGLP